VTPTDLPFDQINLVDFEFISKRGEHPDVVCLAWHELRSGQTTTLWRDQIGAAPPYRTDARSLFVCFAATAEVCCHLALGWPVPAAILDLSPEFRRVANGRKVPAGKGLLGAQVYYGLDPISSKHKDAMRERILQGWPYSAEEREEILRYCASDAEAMVSLLSKMLPEIDLATALHRGEWAAVSAIMEHRGVPVDQEICPHLLDKRTWTLIRDDMVPIIDATYGVYVRNNMGTWSFNVALFEGYCADAGIPWPRHENGKLDLRRKTFDAMAKCYPELEDLRQLRYARNQMRTVKLAVGCDSRNRTVLWPFKAKTGRTQPKAARWVFSPAAWMRSLIKPGPGRAVAYIDFSAMEFLIAGVLSECRPMIDLYNSGDRDPYLGFARRVGTAPASATKASHGGLRDALKVALLSAQYGISAASLALRLNVSTFEAHEMLDQHHGLFAKYWRWSDDWMAVALDTGIMRTPMGWTIRTGITELNDRSIRNWIIQAVGADILQIACIWANRRGIELCAPIHDAVLVEAPIDQIDAHVALMREIMRRASRVVLNVRADGPYELRTDATIVKYPDRYSDKRGVNIWARVLELLEKYRTAEDADAGLGIKTAG
jgi:hypothetical protein